MKAINNRYPDLISDIAQYIYENLDGDVRIEVLAQRFGVSKYHLNRIFHSITGFQLGQYIQRQRMNRAAKLLASDKSSVIDVSLAVGYESHSAFSRAFVKAFGFKPSEVKDQPFLENQQASAANITPVETLTPTICELPARKIVGLYGQGFHDHTFLAIANQLYESLHEELKAIDGITFAEHRLVGVSIDSPWRGEQAQCRFFAGLDLDVDERTKHLPCYEWQSGQWGKFVHTGAYRHMWQTISLIYSSWVIPHGIELRDSAIVQVYANSPRETPEAQLETHLYIGIAD